MSWQEKPTKKRFTDITRPDEPTRAEEPIKITPLMPVKKTRPLRVAPIIVSVIILVYLFFYALSSLFGGEFLKNAFRSLLSAGTPEQSENVFKKFSEDLKKQMEDSGLSPLLKSLPESFSSATSVGQGVLAALDDVDYLSEYGLALALNQKGDLLLEKLGDLKNNVRKIKEASTALKNQPFINLFATSSATTTDEMTTAIKSFDFNLIENFLAALIDWLKAKPEQHLLMVFSDKFYSDIAIKNANITNIVTTNVKNKTTKFGGMISIDMPVIQEISQMVGFDTETQGFSELFPQFLDKIANSDKNLRSVIYGKIGNAFTNKEILVSFPNEAIQLFFDEFRQKSL